MIDRLIAIDRDFFLFLNSFHAQWLNPVMEIFSGQAVWSPFVIYFFIIAYKKGGGRATALFGLFLLLAIIASDVTSSYLLKNLTDRLRPCRDIDLNPFIYSFGQRCGGKYGFVSSHAANSFALVIFSLRGLHLKQKWLHALWVLPALVGYSRIYLGVHYPGDVLGGTIVGLGWGFIFSQMYRSTQGASRSRSQA